ncbi:MAG: hypothetical protein SCALA702_02660 [Melioribacteraceae bacterium]|nr:MAG: hypothetical protein SCALA702_02660 [Melioribacteraceae bacterium]
MHKFSLLLFLILVSLTQAQEIRVLNETKAEIDGIYSHAMFSPNSEEMYFTTDNYIGLWKYNIESKNVEQISDEMGAGYRFSFDKSGNKIYYRTDQFSQGKRYSTIIEKDLLTNRQSNIESNLRNATPPVILNSGKSLYFVNNTLKEAGIANESAKNDIAVLSRGYDIVLFRDGKTSELKPLGNKHYIWASLSPDQNKVLFTVPGEGTFISDIAGNILAEFGYANAAKWSGDSEYIVFMKDFDDGHVVTSSDIYVAKADGSFEQNITNSGNRIELYPSWSADGSKILFNTSEGEIYYLTVETAEEE